MEIWVIIALLGTIFGSIIIYHSYIILVIIVYLEFSCSFELFKDFEQEADWKRRVEVSLQ